MATKLPRLNVVLEPKVYRAIQRLSQQEGMSLSLVARDLIREALTIYEDSFWSREAETRESTFLRKKALTHNQVWNR